MFSGNTVSLGGLSTTMGRNRHITEVLLESSRVISAPILDECLDVHWEVMLEGLQAPEPAVRSLTLSCMSEGIYNIHHTLFSKDLLLTLTQQLCVVMCGDVSSRSSFHAALLLSHVYAQAGAKVPWLEVQGFMLLRELFETTFSRPAVSESRSSKDTSSKRSSSTEKASVRDTKQCPDNQGRVYILNALNRFLECPSALQPDTHKMIHSAYLSLFCSGQESYFVKAQILLGVSMLSYTTQNRSIALKYFPTIRTLILREQYPFFREALSKFVSKWYPVVPDQVVAIFPASTLLRGYALKRLEQMKYEGILKDLQERYQNNPDTRNGLVLSEEENVSLDGSSELQVLTRRFANRILTKDPDTTEPSKAVFLPEHLHLTLNNTPDTLLFNAGQHTHTLTLNNKSPSDTYRFIVQVSDGGYYAVYPSFGSIAPKKKLTIEVRFTPPLSDIPGTVSAYLRLRTASGFPLQRIGLKGVTGPSLKVFCRELNFGVCAPGTERSVNVYIRNSSIVPTQVSSYCMEQTQKQTFEEKTNDEGAIANNGPSNIESCFQAYPEKLFLRPGDTKCVTVVFYPRTSLQTEGIQKGTLCIEGMGRERYFVKFQGSVGLPLSVAKPFIDLGNIMQGSTEPVHRAIIMTNHDPNLSIPVSVRTEYKAFTIRDVVIPPNTTIRCPVSFDPTQCHRNGHVTYNITLSTPNMHTINMEAFVHIGDMLLLDCGASVSLAPVPPLSIEPTYITARNTSRQAVEFVISGLRDTPYLFHVHTSGGGGGGGTSSSRTSSIEYLYGGNTLDATILTKNHRQSFKLGPFQVCRIGIWCYSKDIGFYTARLHINLLYPSNTTYGPFHLKCAVLDAAMLESNATGLEVLEYLNQDSNYVPGTRRNTHSYMTSSYLHALPSLSHSTSAILQMSTRLALSTFSSFSPSSSVPLHVPDLAISPQAIWLISSEIDDLSTHIMIQNQGKHALSLHIVTGSLFRCDGPLKVTLEAGEQRKVKVMYVPEEEQVSGQENESNRIARPTSMENLMDEKAVASSRDRKNALYQCGHCSFIASTGGISSVCLRGVLGSPIRVSSDSSLSNLMCESGTPAEAIFHLTNITDVCVSWQMQLKGNFTLTSQSPSRGPFTLMRPDLSPLKPFERRTCVLRFLSSDPGIFRDSIRILFLSSPDSFYTLSPPSSSSPRDSGTMDAFHPMPVEVWSHDLCGRSGGEEFSVAPSFVDMGDCPIDVESSSSLAIRNTRQDNILITALARHPLVLRASSMEVSPSSVAPSTAISTMAMEQSWAHSVNMSVPAASSARLAISMRPLAQRLSVALGHQDSKLKVRLGASTSILSISSSNRFENVNVLANHGILKAVCPLGPPVHENKQFVVDLGFVRVGEKLQKSFPLRNEGTLAFVVQNVDILSVVSFDDVISALESPVHKPLLTDSAKDGDESVSVADDAVSQAQKGNTANSSGSKTSKEKKRKGKSKKGGKKKKGQKSPALSAVYSEDAVPALNALADAPVVDDPAQKKAAVRQFERSPVVGWKLDEHVEGAVRIPRMNNQRGAAKINYYENRQEKWDDMDEFAYQSMISAFSASRKFQGDIDTSSLPLLVAPTNELALQLILQPTVRDAGPHEAIVAVTLGKSTVKQQLMGTMRKASAAVVSPADATPPSAATGLPASSSSTASRAEAVSRVLFRVKYIAQVLLSPSSTSLLFGVVPLFFKKALSFGFHNGGDVNVPWSLSVIEYTTSKTKDHFGTPVADDADPTTSDRDITSWPCTIDEKGQIGLGGPPFGTRSAMQSSGHRNSDADRPSLKIFPFAGTLAPHKHQNIDVHFSPQHGHTEYKCVLALDTAGIGRELITVMGVGGVVNLTVDKPIVDFGCLNIADTRSITVHVQNRGEITAKFKCLPESRRFTVAPVEGVIRPGSFAPLSVSFCPIGDRPIQSLCRIKYGPATTLSYFARQASIDEDDADQNDSTSSAVGGTFVMKLMGEGGHSQLQVKDDLVDFGVVMMNIDNKNTLRVYNEGEAEGLVLVESAHEAVTFDPACLVMGNKMFVPSASYRDLTIVFHPTSLAPLSTFVFIRAGEDSGAQKFSVQVIGSVGVPYISIQPPHALEELEFGACEIGTTHDLTFKLCNSGDVVADFVVSLYRPRSVIEGGLVTDEILPIGQYRKNESLFRKHMVPYNPNDITVFPNTGSIKARGEVQFTVSFCPLPSTTTLHTYLVIRSSRFDTILSPITGEVGKSCLRIEGPSRVVNFGTLQIGGLYSSHILISNTGNMPLKFQVTHPLTSSDYVGMSLAAAKDKWKRDLLIKGFIVDNVGICPAHTKIRFPVKFHPKSTGNVQSSLCISNGSVKEVFTLIGEGSMVQVEMVDTDGNPISEMDFGLVTIHRPLTRTFILRNKSNLECQFLMSRNIPHSVRVIPNTGVLKGMESVPVQISFCPHSNRSICFDLKVITAGRTSNLSQEKDSNVTNQLTVRGRGGVSILGVHLLSEVDQKSQALDFGVLACGAVVEKYVAVYNAGTVPMSVLVEIDNPLFSLGTAGSLQKMTSSDILEKGQEKPGHGGEDKAITKEFRASLMREICYMAKQLGLDQMKYERVTTEADSEDEEESMSSIAMGGRFSLLQGLQRSGAQNSVCIVLDIPPAHWQPIYVKLPVSNNGTITTTLYLVKQSDAESETTAGSSSASAAASSSRRDHLPRGRRDRTNPAPATTAADKPTLNERGSLVAPQRKWLRSESIVNPIHGSSLAVSPSGESFSKTSSMFRTGTCVAYTVRAHSGTVTLVADSSLNFGDIGSKHRYSRSLRLMNVGTLPVSANLYWKVKRIPEDAGYDVSQIIDGKSVVELVPGTSSKSYGPRFRWIKSFNRLRILFEAYRILYNVSPTMTCKDHWLRHHRTMHIQAMSPRSQARSRSKHMDPGVETMEGVRRIDEDMKLEKLVTGGGRKTNLPSNHPLLGGLVKLVTKGNMADKKISQLVSQMSDPLSMTNDPFLQDLLLAEQELLLQDKESKFVAKKTLTSMIDAINRLVDHVPQLRCSPNTVQIWNGGHVDVMIHANFPCGGSFSAVLVVDSNVPGVASYEIPLSAHADNVEFCFEDPTPLAFGYIPIGETQVIEKTITNHSNISSTFEVIHTARHLVCTPSKGTIRPHSSQVLRFAFSPVDQNMYRCAVRIQTSFCAPLFVSFSGAGGVPNLVCLEGSSISFGRSLVGKEMVKSVTLKNTGTAAFLFESVELLKGLAFGGMADWPSRYDKILPGGKFDLSIAFRPLHEDTYSDCLIVKSSSCRTLLLELRGIGREALLLYDKHFIDFHKCILGNAYTCVMSLMNVGEVDYPLKLSIKPDPSHPLPDETASQILNSVSVEPRILSLGAFEKRDITIRCIPTLSHSMAYVKLAMDSIYSYHEVQITLKSGSASLQSDPAVVDLGMFKVNEQIHRTLRLSNNGDMPLSFNIRNLGELATQAELPFKLSKSHGVIPASSSYDIIVSTSSSERNRFSHEICIETEKNGVRDFVTIQGNCEEPLLHPDSLKTLEFGVQPVGRAVSLQFYLRNDGGYPLDFTFSPQFPLSVSPVSGSVPGYDSTALTCTWTPTGGYELSSSLSFHTGSGVHAIYVKGLGVHPVFKLKQGFHDFGVVPVGQSVTRSTKLVNKGKVDLEWHIPHIPPGFTVHPESGCLQPQMSTQLHFTFSPFKPCTFKGNLMVAAKARNKELTLTGIGGSLSVEVPKYVDMGECPQDVWIPIDLPLANKGDMTANLRITLDLAEEEKRDMAIVLHIPRNRADEYISIDEDQIVSVVPAGQNPIDIPAYLYLSSSSSSSSSSSLSAERAADGQDTRTRRVPVLFTCTDYDLTWRTTLTYTRATTPLGLSRTTLESMSAGEQAVTGAHWSDVVAPPMPLVPPQCTDVAFEKLTQLAREPQLTLSLRHLLSRVEPRTYAKCPDCHASHSPNEPCLS